MKADISIPNPIFKESEKTTQKLGISLDEFCTAALAAYIAEYKIKNITDKLNQVYDREPSFVDPVLMRLQTASLEDEIW